MTCLDSCTYLWDWYYIWAVRSRVLKAAALMLLLAFVLDLVALTTGYWLVSPSGHTGLFDGTVRGSADTPVHVPIVCPILAVLSAVILLCDNVLNLLFVTRQFALVMPAVIVFAFIGALMIMTVIVTWSVPDVTLGQHLSWSFIVAAAAVVVDMVGCALSVMEFLARSERSRPIRNNYNNNTNTQTQASSPSEVHFLESGSASGRIMAEEEVRTSSEQIEDMIELRMT